MMQSSISTITFLLERESPINPEKNIYIPLEIKGRVYISPVEDQVEILYIKGIDNYHLSQEEQEIVEYHLIEEFNNKTLYLRDDNLFNKVEK